MSNDKDSAVTQADIDAAKLYLQGTGPWALDEIGIGPDDSLAIAFARHRIASSQPTQSDGLQTDALDFGNELIFACAGLRHAPVETEAVFSVTWDGFPFDVTVSLALQEQER